MDWSSLGGQLAQIGLPALGTLLGGPLGGTVGAVVGKGIAAALGVAPTPEAVSQAVAQDPAAAQTKLAEIEAETKRQDAYLADIANARQMQVALVQAHSWTGTTPAILTYLVVGAAIALTFCLFFVSQEIPERIFNLLNQSYGALWLAVGLGVQFWWGSSRTSQQKDQQAAQFSAAVTNAALTSINKR
ncbi:hypothetical protein FF100_05005 [Methylobacterium terricola]|uniref:Holin of 3TMs, for gene-transfer release n=1 Tax=Methylobacterium terricola TaxID=2583531 RepID=A0A5C4LKC2_9HYPH|nr:hypothetical protein [Methylobacterium terricola]TNC14936.1 hypothetical protein FF100_05005 [Methylobacterium terricola]